MNKNKMKNLCFYILLFIICLIMLHFINQKRGFHADEMFSYGSANYKYDNVFCPYGDRDYINRFMNDNIKNIGEIKKYLSDIPMLIEKIDKIKKEDKPIWKNKKEAIEYVTIQKDEIFNFFSVYYNQSRDAHPPLFYYTVHIISSVFLNNFSKYIIFIINISAFIGTCILIKKSLKVLRKEYLTIPVTILYGLSMGGISTVIFQRMYMLLAFFITYYSYLCIQFSMCNFKLSKKMKLKFGIVTILGFLTHYYFCIYIAFLVIFFSIKIYKNHGKKEFIEFTQYYFKLAILGIMLFPASIYHIFFSYRGVSSISNKFNLLNFIELIFNAYSLNYTVGYIILIGILIINIIRIMQKKDDNNLMLLIPISGFIIISSKLSPYLELRYIMGILPIISLIFWISVDYILKYYKKQCIIVMSIMLIIFSINKINETKPLYIYSEYQENIKIASENNNSRFIYIHDNGYNHIQNMQEFMIYKESLIIDVSKDELKYLKNNSKLLEENDFVLSIKKYMNIDEIIQKVIELTQFTKFNTLLNSDENIILKFYR